MLPRPQPLPREILDELDPDDPRAVRSRRDLERVNRFMGAPGILARALDGALARVAPSQSPPRLLELGAGDGALTLAVATRLAASWPTVELTLLDRQSLLAPATGTAFARLGWSVHCLNVDVLAWARAPLPARLPPRWNLVLANLFLHHFEDGRLGELLAAVASRCDAFVALEPRRGATALVGAHLLGALGVNDVTRHDGVLSVRAGFRERELSVLWPGGESWQREERRAGLFGHLFRATRLREP
jgi:hypothetical protein